MTRFALLSTLSLACLAAAVPDKESPTKRDWTLKPHFRPHFSPGEPKDAIKTWEPAFGVKMHYITDPAAASENLGKVRVRDVEEVHVSSGNTTLRTVPVSPTSTSVKSLVTRAANKTAGTPVWVSNNTTVQTATPDHVEHKRQQDWMWIDIPEDVSKMNSQKLCLNDGYHLEDAEKHYMHDAQGRLQQMRVHDGYLIDEAGRFGYIAKDNRMQFGPLPPIDARYNAGWTIAGGSSVLAIGGNNRFWACRVRDGWDNIYYFKTEVPLETTCQPMFMKVQQMDTSCAGSWQVNTGEQDHGF